MDVVTALERAYGQTATLVTDLDAARLDAPSPCDGWDVRSTLNHLVGATWMVTLVNEGRAAGEDAGDVIGDDPSLAVAAAVKENLASWNVTARAWCTTFAPILISFSRSVVSVHDRTDRGSASCRKKLAKL